MKNNHSENCCHNDNEALLYALMKGPNETKILISAQEISLFDKYLDLAHAKDKGVIVDMDSCDDLPYKIVYGGIMFGNEDWEPIKKYADELKGYAIIDIREDEKDLKGSCYDAIMFFEDDTKREKFIPFAALMRTDIELKDSETSVTMFPHCDGMLWECMVNRPFLLACRETESVGEDVGIENWREHIDKDKLMKAYKVADLYTGEK